MLLQWHVKDPSHSAKSAGGSLHLNMHTSMTQWSQYELPIPLSRHSVGTYLETSSHATCQGTLGQSSRLAEPLWTDPGIKSGISVHELISTLKKRKKCRQGMNGQTFSQNHCRWGKSHPHHLEPLYCQLSLLWRSPSAWLHSWTHIVTCTERSSCF